MNITRLVKRESGDPTFESIDDEADVVKLAGRHAPLDVVEQFGIDPARDAGARHGDPAGDRRRASTPCATPASRW